MDQNQIDAFKTYVSNSLKHVDRCIKSEEDALLIAARVRNIDALDKALKQIEILEAIRTYIVGLQKEFPELKG